MKTIYNNIIPFKGFRAMSFCGIIFARTSSKPLSKETINHESIHLAQQKEWLFVGFFLLYLIEFIFKGYMNISFEKEAYTHSVDLNYLKTRKRYANYRKRN